MAAYTTAQLIADYLGVTLTAPQIAQATLEAQAATDWIDKYLSRSWQGSSPLTETLRLYGDRVWVNRPITAITSVSVRGTGVSDTATVLNATTGYRILDAAAGEIAIAGYEGYRATIVYTSSGVVPTPVAKAATMLAAWWLQTLLHPEQLGVKRIAVGNGDLDITYTSDSDLADSRGLPAPVVHLLGLWRVPVVA